MGGELDESNSCVNLEITKSGQYILAVDNCPPAITQFNASDNGISPKISAIVSDMSGISEFKFSIDDTEILNSQNFEKYYDFTTAKFEYPTEGLSDGEYTATIFAIDTFGNEIEQSISFTVNTTAPSIDNVSELGETVSDATEVTAKVSGDEILSVFLNTETTDAFGNVSVTSVEMNGENGVLTQAQRKNVDDNVVFEGIEFKSKIKAFLWDDLTPLCESATLINTSEIQ